jgi:cytochrome c553
MSYVSRWGQKTALLALGFWLVASLGEGIAADGKDSVVPDADYPKLVDQQIKVLQDALKALKDAKEDKDKKAMTNKSRCTAVMIAAIAQDNLGGKDGTDRAALRDAALNVAALVKAALVNSSKVDEAMKKAAELKSVKGDGKAKMQKLKLYDDHINLTELMSQFKLPKAGGQGTETLLLNLATDKKKTIPPAALNEALLLTAYRTAVASELAIDHVPDKDPKSWKNWSIDMRKGSIEFAEKIKAKDGKAAFSALSKLNTSCSVCHEKFK